MCIHTSLTHSFIPAKMKPKSNWNMIHLFSIHCCKHSCSLIHLKSPSLVSIFDIFTNHISNMIYTLYIHYSLIKNKSFLHLWKNFSPLAPFSSAPSAPASFAAVPFAAVLPALNSSLLFRPLLLCPFRFFLPRCRRLFFNSRHLLQQSPLIFNNCPLFLNCWPPLL